MANVQLTEEIVGPGTRRKATLTVALALALFVVADLVARWVLTSYTPNLGYFLIHSKWRKLQSLAKPVDWVVLGDSSGNQGFRPDVWDRLGMGSSMNFCTIGDLLAVNDAWMLQTYLSRHPPPKGVIIIHTADMWNRSPHTLRTQLLGKIPVRYGFWDRLQPRLPVDGNDKLGFLLGRYAPLYTENVSLGEWILHPVVASEKLGRFSIDERGYMRVDAPDPAEVRRSARAPSRQARKNAFRLSRANSEALIRIRELATERGVDVYFAHGPAWDGVLRQEAFRAFVAAEAAKLEAVAARSPRTHYILAEPVGFTEEQMVSWDHLTHDGAEIYTERLAEAVRDVQSGKATKARAPKGEPPPKDEPAPEHEPPTDDADTEDDEEPDAGQ